MKNLSTLLTIALLLCAAMQTCTARPEPAYFASFTTSLAETLSLEMIESKLHDVVGESCDKEDDEDCLMRRALTAHLDYIYTQKKINP
ncbi:PREDICTED: putative phytosulfokines 4 [Camelina sativa]|uniref:Phytosulfokine n=1 Tax=Camelina sativa TaxID=90675 RepID=A0ABM1QHE7_CAMSA|nr:PREDICTED: putative phytosulfokines 4 [Camelina sativa]